jgi:hypothetical protein
MDTEDAEVTGTSQSLFKLWIFAVNRGCCKTSVLQQQPLKNACFIGL